MIFFMQTKRFRHPTHQSRAWTPKPLRHTSDLLQVSLDFRHFALHVDADSKDRTCVNQALRGVPQHALGYLADGRTEECDESQRHARKEQYASRQDRHVLTPSEAFDITTFHALPPFSLSVGGKLMSRSTM